MSVTPFTIAIPDNVLTDLRARLDATRWPDELDDAGWDYGMNRSVLRTFVDRWRGDFDWRAQERELNALDQITVEVDGIGIHAVHVRGAGPSPTPLLLLHGWPSSFVQMRHIVPLLTGGSPSFDVIVPSLPGYGFSDRPTQRGMSVARIATLFHTLMTDHLGYARYGVRGSDLGAGVATQLALAHPEAVIGVHTGGTNPWLPSVPEDLTPEETEYVADAQAWNGSEMAYAMLHASKPQTVAYGLNDSPTGLAAWMLEKFQRWSDHDGDLTSAFAIDELLANLTIYWATGTIGSSMRLYYETMRDFGLWGHVTVPTAMLMSPRDMFPTPRSWVERTARIDRWTEIPRGGHFLEWEVPDLVASDIRAFFSELT